jgi:hypothetical protein
MIGCSPWSRRGTSRAQGSIKPIVRIAIRKDEALRAFQNGGQEQSRWRRKGSADFVGREGYVEGFLKPSNSAAFVRSASLCRDFAIGAADADARIRKVQSRSIQPQSRGNNSSYKIHPTE